jgi:hypothetical protein
MGRRVDVPQAVPDAREEERLAHRFRWLSAAGIVATDPPPSHEMHDRVTAEARRLSRTRMPMAKKVAALESFVVDLGLPIPLPARPGYSRHEP